MRIAAALLLFALPEIAIAQAITPVPEGTKFTLTFSVSSAAERRTADADPLGPRSHFKVQRAANVTCHFVARAPQGIGPDGPTPEQQAIFDEAEKVQGDAAAQLEQPGPATASLQARLAACGEDSNCQMRVALEVANDPELQRQAEAEAERNAQMMVPVDEASARVEAMTLEPNWQILVVDSDPRVSGEPACKGEVSVNDLEVYRLGFDGGDMGEGVETRKGAAPIEGVGLSVIWFDLKNGGTIIDVGLGGFFATVESVNVGGRDNSRNAGFRFNEDWEPDAGKGERLERGGVTAIPGRWTFAMPIEPTRHDGFQGAADFEWNVTPR